MLRINLLPPYIYDKQKKYKWIAGSVAMFAAVVALMLWWIAVSQKDLEEAQAANATAKDWQTKYNGKVADIQREQAAIAVTKAKMEFISNAIKYNQAWPDTYSMMRDLTSPNVLLKDMSVADDHKTISLAGFSQREEDLVRWWMFLRATKIFGSVHFNLPEHPWPPKADTATSAGGPGSMGASSPSSPGGFSPTATASMSTKGPSSFGSSGMAYGGSTGAGGFGGRPGGTTAVGDEEIEGRKGISFTATAVLQKPLAGGVTLPNWTGAAAPAAATAAPGMGMMGGSAGGRRAGPGD